jgi:hypothetical protein
VHEGNAKENGYEPRRLGFERAIGSDPGRGAQRRNAPLKLFRFYVVRFRWNDSPHPSPRIWVIASPPWNKMNVAVHHSLTGDLPAIGSYVKTRNGRVRFANKGPRFRNQLATST